MKIRIGWSVFSFGIAEEGLVLHAKLLKTDFSVKVRKAPRNSGKVYFCQNKQAKEALADSSFLAYLHLGMKEPRFSPGLYSQSLYILRDDD